MASCRGMNRRAKKPLKPPRWTVADDLTTLGSERCSICLDVITVRGKLPVCEHCYCYTCILEWSKKINQCPICKRIFRCISKISFQSPKRQVRIPDTSRLEDSFNETTDNPLAFSGIAHEHSRNIDQYDLEDSFIDDSELVKSPPVVKQKPPPSRRVTGETNSSGSTAVSDENDFRWYSSRQPLKKRRRIVCSFDD